MSIAKWKERRLEEKDNNLNRLNYQTKNEKNPVSTSFFWDNFYYVNLSISLRHKTDLLLILWYQIANDDLILCIHPYLIDHFVILFAKASGQLSVYDNQFTIVQGSNILRFVSNSLSLFQQRPKRKQLWNQMILTSVIIR